MMVLLYCCNIIIMLRVIIIVMCVQSKVGSNQQFSRCLVPKQQCLWESVWPLKLFQLLNMMTEQEKDRQVHNRV